MPADNPLKKYYSILASLPNDDYEDSIEYLKSEIDKLFVSQYKKATEGSMIMGFEVKGYTYLFDQIIEDIPPDIVADDRIVGAYGVVNRSGEKRDKSRMQGFIGSFPKSDRYYGFDKGHYISHKINGSMDHNLYPQLTDFNRGRSKEGKLFRSMERYCEQNPGVFVFTRPIYTDSSWLPSFIDYGIVTRNMGLLLNRFDNRRKQKK